MKEEIIVICSNTNQHFIGKLVKIKNNGIITVKDAYLINNSIRSEKNINIGNFKYIDNSEIIFSNYMYYAKPNKDYIDLYLQVMKNSERDIDGNQ